jgi:hypothetical protein
MRRWFRIWMVVVLFPTAVLLGNLSDAIVTDDRGGFVCSAARSGSGVWYTAEHCLTNGKLYLNGRDTPYAHLLGDIIQIGSDTRQSDKGVLTADRVRTGMQVRVRIGGLSRLTEKPSYFDVETKILAVYSSADLKYRLDAPDDAGWYALVHLGAFSGCSGSGVYYRGRLIGVVCAGIAGEYTFVALIPPTNARGDRSAVQK